MKLTDPSDPALHLLVLPCMSVTLDEIKVYEERLRREIVERECLLAAFKVLHGYMDNGHGQRSIELGFLASALASAPPAALLPKCATEVSPAPPALPAPPPVPRYVHPELAAIKYRHGANTTVVAWAIQRMTDDYSLLDIRALLEREGYPLQSSEISVVLTRLKRRGKIEEVQCGSGPHLSIFRKPENAIPQEIRQDDRMENRETMTPSAAAA